MKSLWAATELSSSICHQKLQASLKCALNSKKLQAHDRPKAPTLRLLKAFRLWQVNLLGFRYMVSHFLFAHPLLSVTDQVTLNVTANFQV